MIRITDNRIGVQILFEGKIKEVSKKINFNELTSIRGGRFTESVRGVKDLEVTINYIAENDYNRLQDIFLLSNNSLEVENIDTGKIYVGYFIAGDTISLDEYEDYENKNYYYKGGLNLYKR